MKRFSLFLIIAIVGYVCVDEVRWRRTKAADQAAVQKTPVSENREPISRGTIVITESKPMVELFGPHELGIWVSTNAEKVGLDLDRDWILAKENGKAEVCYSANKNGKYDRGECWEIVVKGHPKASDLKLRKAT